MAYGIGIIGAGGVVQRAYLPVLSERNDCQIVAICSREGRSARELAPTYNIPRVCGGYEELIERADVDVVFLATPPHLHREICEYAMLKQKHILVEKPVCASYRDSKYLFKRGRNYAKMFYAAFNNYFREENQWLQSQVTNGEVGNVEVIDLEWHRTRRYENKTWLYDPTLSGGGVLMDLGSHMIHFALSLIPQRTQFVGLCNNITHEWQPAVESTCSAMITVNEKISISLRLGWDMQLPVKSSVALRVCGSGRCLSNQEYRGGSSDGYSRMIDDFFNCIDSATRPNLELAEDTMLLVNALYESARSRSVVHGQFCSGG